MESHHVYFYTVEDVQGRFLNLVECRSRFLFELRWNKATNQQWDVAKTPYLWFLFSEAMLKKDTGFMPSKIHKVTIPPDA